MGAGTLIRNGISNSDGMMMLRRTRIGLGLQESHIMYLGDNRTFPVEERNRKARGVVWVGTPPLLTLKSNLKCTDMESS